MNIQPNDPPWQFGSVAAALMVLFLKLAGLEGIAQQSSCYNPDFSTFVPYDHCLCITNSDGSGDKVFFGASQALSCQEQWMIGCQPTMTAFTFVSLCLAEFPHDGFQANDDYSKIKWKIVGSQPGLVLTNQGSYLGIFPGCSIEIRKDASQGTPTFYAPFTLTLQVEDTVNDVVRTGSIYVHPETDCHGSYCATGSSVTTCNSSLAAFFSLGRTSFGKSAGGLSLHETAPSHDVSTPASLVYAFLTNQTGCVVLTNSSGIRQVLAQEMLADIVATNSRYFYINFYHPDDVGGLSGGFYTVSGSPTRSVKIENPDATGATSNRLHITDGEGYLSQYEWLTNGWELVKGSGIFNSYKETVWSQSNTVRTSTQVVRDQNDAVVERRVRKYVNAGFGTKLVEEVRGEGAQCLTNCYSYVTNCFGTGLLQRVCFADGHWEHYLCNTNFLATNRYSAYLDQGPTTNNALCRSTHFYYGSNAIPGAADGGFLFGTEPRLTIDCVEGHEVGRRYMVLKVGDRREIQCVNPGDPWDAQSNLVTRTLFYTNGVNAARRKSVEYPDGTMELFDYIIGTQRTNIILRGQPNGGKTDIVDGTKEITVVGAVGQPVRKTLVDIASGITNSHEVFSDYDSFNRPKKVTHLDGTFDWTDHGCCGPITETNREGTLVKHFKDPVGRHAARTINGITITNVFDAAGNILKTIRTGSDSSEITQATNLYDTAGRLLSTTDALGNTTTYSEVYTNDQLFLRTTTYPGGGTRIEQFYRDGQIGKLTGTAVHPMRYEYGTVQDNGVWRRYAKEIKLDGTGADTSEVTTNFFDMLGRNYKTAFAGGAVKQTFYNTKGQRIKEVDPDGVVTLFQYNGRGELDYSAIDMDRDGVIDFDQSDRISQTVANFTTGGGKDVSQIKSYQWKTFGSTASNLLSTSQSSTDGLKSWSIANGLTNLTDTVYGGSGNRYLTNTAADGSTTLGHFQHGQLKSLTRKDAAGTQISQASYGYDAHGRQVSATDARNGATYFYYDNADRKTAVLSPEPGNGQARQYTSYAYDALGRLTVTTLPDGAKTTNEYHTAGELKKTTGSRVYPVEYGYDAQGRKTNMVTWKDYGGDSGKAFTQWTFDSSRGFLTGKLYDGGNGPAYAYTPAGRLRTRTWARGITSTYTTNAAGDVVQISYSDGATSNAIYNLDRLGRRTNIVDGAGSRYLVYSDSGQMLMETNASGVLAALSLTLAYDGLERRSQLKFFTNTTTALFTHSHGYDGASRLTNVTDGTHLAAYSFLANSPLINQITHRTSGTARMTTSKTYDRLNRLLGISSQPSASGVAAMRFDYTHNEANQRTKVVQTDGTYWLYEYDKLGQLASAKHYWADGTPMAGQQHEYDYDDIGNRTATRSGGDARGAGLRSDDYTANALNQYTSRDVAGAVDAIGIAKPTESVVVNGQSAYRKGEYFWREVALDNSSAALWASITNSTVVGGAPTSNIVRKVFLPKTEETFAYDADGNMTNDGRWVLTWDAENRLVSLVALSGVPTGAKKKLAFAYDEQGRRVHKKTYDWNTNTLSYDLSGERKFVYDGWNIIAELDGANNRIRSYLWGIDLSGSLQGAGGVGGLLMVDDAASGAHFVAYDGNGNVRGLVKTSDGTVSAKYDYDPFGQTLRASGDMAARNPCRFSTKHQDEDSGFYYYGFRCYNPSTGRWPNRDPIQDKSLHTWRHKTRKNRSAIEWTEQNLYNFVFNSPTAYWDKLGLECRRCSEICTEANLDPYVSLISPGGLVCGDNGRMCACYLPGQKYPHHEVCPEIVKIVIDHELSHFKDFTCVGRQPLTLPNPLPSWDPIAGECAPRRQSIIDLELAISLGTDSLECLDAMVEMHGELKAWVEENCP